METGPRDRKEEERCERFGHALELVAIPQEEIAARLGITPSHLSAIKHSRRHLSRSIAYRMQEEFAIQARWLMNGQGPMQRATNGDVYAEGQGAFSHGKERPAPANVYRRLTYRCGNCHAEVAPALESCYRCGAPLVWPAE